MIGCLAAALLLVIPALGLRPASADVVELKGGDRVEGALKEATPAGVVVEVGGQSIRFEASSVRAIYFGSPVPPAPPDAPPASAAPPAPSVPPSPGAGALQIVQSLRATVATGTTLRDYETRLHGVAPLVELYLAGMPPAPGAAIRDAMRYYVLAAWGWNNLGMTSRTVWLRKDDALARCPAYQEFARAMQVKGEAYYAERTQNYVVIADGAVPVLWSCAAEKVAEAETLLLKAEK